WLSRLCCPLFPYTTLFRSMLAPDLVDLVSGGQDDLLARVRGLRRKIAMELGLVLPPVRTRDSVELPSATYVVMIAGVEVGRGSADRKSTRLNSSHVSISYA